VQPARGDSRAGCTFIIFHWDAEKKLYYGFESKGLNMKRKAFTLIELLVVIAIIALLLAILMPSLNKVKELAKRAVCLSSVRQLTMSWIMYAGENDDKICAANVGNSKWGWVAKKNFDGTPDEQIESIRAGVLFPYVETVDIYTCPTAKKDEVRSYSAVSSMNTGNTSYKGKIYKKLSKVRNRDSMLVFVCEGQISSYAYNVRYFVPEWASSNLPPIRHGEGTVFSFVDGHSDSWNWEHPDTVKFAEGDPSVTASQPGNPDLERVTRGIWGKLGYDIQN
jgi:prepilin-type N-terminal cleavage/methylation domain-containing protein/prepilin-type processing-associated H-X9-DG protein